MRKKYIITIIFIFILACHPYRIANAQPDTIITNNNIVNFIETIKNIENSVSEDNYNYTFKKQEIQENIESFKHEFILNINQLLSEKKYDTAISYFNEFEYLFKNDPQIISLKNQLLNHQKDGDLNHYNGNIEILSIAPIIAYPKLVFDGKNSESNRIDANHITISEFEKILLSLYENNYVLISPNMLYDKIDQDYIMLPQNKKPLLLILSDVTYESKSNGCVDKLILDNNNRIATYTPKLAITERIEYNKDFVTILEEFLHTHPSFSYNKAKALIIVDGSKGIFGYNTQKSNTTSNQNIKKAIRVINHLSSIGYSFASSGYNGNINNDKITFANALNTWKTDVLPYLNNSYNIYYSTIPYSDLYESNISLLLDYKYNIIIGCDLDSDARDINGIYYFPSKVIGGNNLRDNQDKFSHLFNCEYVYDHINRYITYNIQ